MINYEYDFGHLVIVMMLSSKIFHNVDRERSRAINWEGAYLPLASFVTMGRP